MSQCHVITKPQWPKTTLLPMGPETPKGRTPLRDSAKGLEWSCKPVSIQKLVRMVQHGNGPAQEGKGTGQFAELRGEPKASVPWHYVCLSVYAVTARVLLARSIGHPPAPRGAGLQTLSEAEVRRECRACCCRGGLSTTPPHQLCKRVCSRACLPPQPTHSESQCLRSTTWPAVLPFVPPQRLVPGRHSNVCKCCCGGEAGSGRGTGLTLGQAAEPCSCPQSCIHTSLSSLQTECLYSLLKETLRSRYSFN